MKETVCILFGTLLMIGNVAIGSEAIYKENFPGGVYIVNGDEPYVSELAIPAKKNSVLRQNNTDLIINTIADGLYDKWKAKDAQSLTYCVSDKFGESKEQIIEAFEVATTDWMNAGNVKYIYMPQHDSKCDHKNANVMFDVRPVTKQPYLARAFFPNTPRVSRNILVDSSAMKHNKLALTGFIRHELGHTLGFRHEHISASSIGKCNEDVNFKPITEYDQSSVMHYPQCGGKNLISNMVLTQTDEEGVRTVYPF